MSDRKERRNTRGRPFAPGNAGRPKGALDRRTVVGLEVAEALAGAAWDEVEKLLRDDSARVRLEAARLVLEYAHGKPRLAVTVSGETEPRLITVEYVHVPLPAQDVPRLEAEGEKPAGGVA